MPANNTGTIQIVARVVASEDYAFSKEDTYAALFQIPSGGTTLTLPDADAAGETYEAIDVDGSCGSSHPIILQASDGQPIQGGAHPSISLTTAFSWLRAVWSGTAWAIEVGSLGGGGTSFISVANTTALANTPVSGLVEGQPAAIRDRLSLWAYNPEDTSGADGWHIPSTTGAGCWVYTGAFDGPTAASSVLWVVDEQNSTGTASDDNDGHSNATALLTFAEVVRRCGGYEPTSTNSTTLNVHFLSSQTTDADPITFRPSMPAGGTILYDAPLPAASFTGSLNAVTAKVNNAAPGNALQSTFTTTTGAIAQGMLLVNNTRGTRAFVDRNVSGGNWQLTQPQSNWAGGAIGPSEDNTWASGDSISGYVLIAAALTDISATQAPGAFVNFVNVNQLTVLDKSGFGLDPLFANYALVQLIDCVCQRNIFAVGSDGFFSQNVFYTGVSATGSGGTVYGGFWGSQSIFTGILWRNDAILHHSPVIIANNIGQEFEQPTCIDTGCTIRYDTGNLNEETFPTGGNVYGGGTFNNLGRVYYFSSTAVATFLCTIELNGLTTGYSRVTVAGATTWHGAIALTAANLDAAAGAAGFGGYADGGGALYTNGSQP